MWSIILAVITAVQIILSFVSLIGTGNTKDVLKNVYWTKVKGGNFKTYWGLFSVDDDYKYWGDYTFTYDQCEDNVCKTCQTAGQVTTSFVVLAIAVLLVGLALHILRCWTAYNTSTLKMITLVTSLLALVSSSVAVIVWGGVCQSALYDKNPGATVTMGPGYAVVLASATLCLFTLAFDFFLATTGAPASLSFPQLSSGFASDGVTPGVPPGPYGSPAYGAYGSPNPMMAPPVYAPPHCGFCGHKSARENPSHPEETARFCPACGRRHIVEEGIKFCVSCGGELAF